MRLRVCSVCMSDAIIWSRFAHSTLCTPCMQRHVCGAQDGQVRAEDQTTPLSLEWLNGAQGNWPLRSVSNEDALGPAKDLECACGRELMHTLWKEVTLSSLPIHRFVASGELPKASLAQCSSDMSGISAGNSSAMLHAGIHFHFSSLRLCASITLCNA